MALASWQKSYKKLAAAWLAATVGGPRSASALGSVLRGPSPHRIAAAWALGNIGDERHVSILEQVTTDPDVDVREMAGFGLEMLRRRLAASASGG